MPSKVLPEVNSFLFSIAASVNFRFNTGQGPLPVVSHLSIVEWNWYGVRANFEGGEKKVTCFLLIGYFLFVIFDIETHVFLK
jgi:hypothetical protein